MDEGPVDGGRDGRSRILRQRLILSGGERLDLVDSVYRSGSIGWGRSNSALEGGWVRLRAQECVHHAKTVHERA